MAQPYVAQIMIFGFTYAPQDWSFCNGSLMSIAQNTALFSLVGTTYGGDGISTFGIPNLQGNAVMNIGQGPGLSNYALGQTSGVPNVTLQLGQLPNHPHQAYATNGTTRDMAPSQNGWFGDRALPGRLFAPTAPNQAFAPSELTVAGGSQPHDNQQPFLVLNYCIALYGVYPSRN